MACWFAILPVRGHLHNDLNPSNALFVVRLFLFTSTTTSSFL